MTAPFRRASVDRTLGNTHARTKKLENEDRLATVDDWSDVNTFPCQVYEDDDSCPTPVFFKQTAALVQQSIIHCFVQLGVFGAGLPGFTPGTGTVFLGKLKYPVNFSAMFQWALDPLSPIGFGWARDDSANLQVPIYFCISDVNPASDPSGTYIQARVLSDASLVGPGNPFTWDQSDIMWSGTFDYLVLTPESVVATPPP